MTKSKIQAATSPVTHLTWTAALLATVHWSHSRTLDKERLLGSYGSAAQLMNSSSTSKLCCYLIKDVLVSMNANFFPVT